MRLRRSLLAAPLVGPLTVLFAVPLGVPLGVGPTNLLALAGAPARASGPPVRLPPTALDSPGAGVGTSVPAPAPPAGRPRESLPRPVPSRARRPLPCATPDALDTLPSHPPCVEIELTADATGRPPLSYAWTLPTGQVLTGNPVTLDTGLLPDGYHELVLEVTNSAGSALHLQPLVVETLGFDTPPALTPADPADPLRVAATATANTRGATEWHWDWGDGTTTGWLGGCPGYAPTHTYPAPGTYTVTVSARSCRAGPVSATGTLELGGSLSLDRFEALCPTAPFCTVAAGEPLAFEVAVSGTLAAQVDAYLYDWDGDGLDDQVATAPVPSHVFPAAGYVTPRLTVLAGTASDTLAHPAPIEVTAGSSLLFSHDFESGELFGEGSSWELP